MGQYPDSPIFLLGQVGRPFPTVPATSWSLNWLFLEAVLLLCLTRCCSMGCVSSFSSSTLFSDFSLFLFTLDCYFTFFFFLILGSFWDYIFSVVPQQCFCHLSHVAPCKFCSILCWIVEDVGALTLLLTPRGMKHCLSFPFEDCSPKHNLDIRSGWSQNYFGITALLKCNRLFPS